MKKIIKRVRQGASIGGTIGKVAGMFVKGSAAVAVAPVSAAALGLAAGTGVLGAFPVERLAR